MAKLLMNYKVYSDYVNVLSMFSVVSLWLQVIQMHILSFRKSPLVILK